MTFGSFDPFTACSERCWSSQPASVNICFSVVSRCWSLPLYFSSRAWMTSRETELYPYFELLALLPFLRRVGGRVGRFSRSKTSKGDRDTHSRPFIVWANGACRHPEQRSANKES